MQRQHSISSATDSGLSRYYGSSSESPAQTPCSSPRLGRSNTLITSRFHPYSPSAEPSFRGARCPSCLEHGEHVPIQLGEACTKCNTIFVDQRSTGKVTRKKRNDRVLYSRLATGGAKPHEARAKDQVEAGNRLDHTTLIGRLQHLLESFNPDLPTQARVGDGRFKLGWKALNPNNTSKDIRQPLTCNKSEVFISTEQAMRDLWATLQNIIDYMPAGDAQRIRASCRSVGTHDFQVPFKAHYKL